MMAYGHAASGWLFTLMVINWLSLFGAANPFITVLCALGAALAAAGILCLPDFDHPNSTASTAFGPFSQIIHKLVVELHYTVCSVTDHAGIRKPPGAHRGVTHWWPFPIVIGALVAWGCWWSPWTTFVLLTVLFAIGIRAITVPDYQARESDTIRHQWAMRSAHGIIDILPFMWPLKAARKYVNQSEKVGGYWTHITIATGKIGTVMVAADFALIAWRSGVYDYGPWLGLMVCVGMWLHILGDSPTEMGVPGWKLTRLWRLPKWLAFRAGGPFEVVFLWIPMTALNIYLIPGLRPHDEVIVVQAYVLMVLGAFAVFAIIVHAIYRIRRQRRWAYR